MNKILILACGLIVALVLWKWPRHKLDMMAKESPPVVSARDVPLTAPTKQVSAPPVSAAVQGTLIAAGVRQNIYPAVPTELQLSFKKVLQWCATGDLHFIKSQSRNAQSKEWRLTLQGESTQSGMDLSLIDMMEARPLALKFPPKDGVYALYLCKKSRGDDCSTQSVWNPMSPQKNEPGIVNVQVIVRKDRRIMALPTQAWDAPALDRMQRIVDSLGLKSGRLLPELYKKISVVRPLSAGFDDKTLSIPLSMNDPQCLSRQ